MIFSEALARSDRNLPLYGDRKVLRPVLTKTLSAADHEMLQSPEAKQI